MRMEWARAFDAAEVRRFAELSGDKGRHHLEADEAGRVMAHGLLTATLPTKLGGDLNFIARTMTFEFLRPVYSGDELSCVGIVDSVEPGKGVLNVGFSFSVRNSKGKEVLRGTSAGVIRNS
ncbi:MAG: enoyl-CoA hydratase [Elusimicrobia bacterium]|nr:enoyl-CoA hydratase [Elusimicrobiota bacterium]